MPPYPSLDLDIEAAQGVMAFRHAGRAQAVSDEDGTCWTLLPPEDTHCNGIHVLTIGNDLGVEVLVIEHCAEHAGLAMFKAAHGVVGVGGGDSTGSDAGTRLDSGRVAVAEADANPKRCCMSDELERAGQLRGDGDEPHRAARRLPEAVKEFHGWSLQILGRMHATLGIGDKRSFQMNTEGYGAGQGFLLDQRCKAIERKQGAIHGRSDERRQPCTHTVLRQQSAHMRDAACGAFHHIVAGSAVHMNVKHCWCEESAGQLVKLGVLRKTIAAVAKAVDDAVFEEQPGIG